MVTIRIALATTLLVLACTRVSGQSVEPAAHVEGPHPQPVEPDAAKPDAAEPDAGEPDAGEPTPSASCPEPATRSGYESCQAVELTGEGPCEEICKAPQPKRSSKCCRDATNVVVFSGPDELLRVSACEFVPPDCANVHGHGNWDAQLRVLQGPPVELVLVEGGCEMRALAHGYVPQGVAAWTGCVHRRYRWDGARLVEVAR